MCIISSHMWPSKNKIGEIVWCIMIAKAKTAKI